MWSGLVEAIKVEYAATRIFPQSSVPGGTTSERISAPSSAYDDKRRRNPPLKSPSQGRHRTHNLRISQRTSLEQQGTVTLTGWPSRGGIVVLENATPPDFDFLHLNPLDPPLRRDADQDAEDTFCKVLLRLGATWWDSEARHNFIRKLEDVDDEALDAVEADEQLGPTPRELAWVRVAWPLRTPGALCVLACEKPILGRRGDEKLRPAHYGIVSLARTMDERCDVLLRLGGKMYASIDEYQGQTFIKAWEHGHQGERGSLIKQDFIDPGTYGGHPDDALGRFGASGSSVE